MGMRHWAKEDENQKILGLSVIMTSTPQHRFALCINNDEAGEEGYLRVVDEPGQDYLYPKSYFVFVSLPREAENALLMTA
jgi:hypothetical protein